MLSEERLEHILDLVRQRKRVSAQDAADYCRVSLGTVRRDFKKLADRNQVIRMHGGILAKENYAYELEIDVRKREHTAAKKAIACKAAEFIGNDEVVAIDAGTTTIHTVEHLKERKHLTVMTYSLDAASEAIKYPALTTLIAGGTIRHKTLSIMGPETIAMLQKIHVNTFLLAASALTLEDGLMNGNSMEAEVKKMLMSISDRVILLMDSSKIGQKALVSFASVEDIDVFITDRGAEPAFVQQVAEKQVNILTV
jgi:DeoR/GlpR family transcriptional regulator of sugar metabolism